MAFFEQKWERIILFFRKTGESLVKSDLDMEESKEMLDVAMCSRFVFQSLEKEDYNTELAWKNVNSKLFKRKKIFHFASYAAVCILLLAIGIILTKPVDLKDSDELSYFVVPADMEQNNTELLLASGERIFLKAGSLEKLEHLGLTLDTMTENNCLDYHNIKNLTHSDKMYNTLFVPHGGEYMIKLEDGTEVWLNSESTLHYPIRFTSNVREVYLDGEAYFKVKKDKSRPFHVFTCEREIRVLGTEFNVCSYSNDKYWHTTLVEGKVEIAGEQEKVLLKPSQQYHINRANNQSSLRIVEAARYSSWREGVFYFKACTLEEIFQQMRRWYDFDVTYEDENLKNIHFTGKVDKHYSLETSLKYIGKTAEISFEVKDKELKVRYK